MTKTNEPNPARTDLAELTTAESAEQGRTIAEALASRGVPAMVVGAGRRVLVRTIDLQRATALLAFVRKDSDRLGVAFEKLVASEGDACPACGYSLSGLALVEVCPECGVKLWFDPANFTIKSERDREVEARVAEGWRRRLTLVMIVVIALAAVLPAAVIVWRWVR